MKKPRPFRACASPEKFHIDECYLFTKKSNGTEIEHTTWNVTHGWDHIKPKQARKLAAWLLKAAEYCEGRNKSK